MSARDLCFERRSTYVWSSPDTSSFGLHRGRLNPKQGFAPRRDGPAFEDAIPLAVPSVPLRSPRRLAMRSSRFRSVLTAALLLGLAAVFHAGVATAVPFWTQEQDISDGDVNDTFTSSNGQPFMCVADS